MNKKLLTKINLIVLVFFLSLSLQLKKTYALGISVPSSVYPSKTFEVKVTGISNIRGKFFVSVSNGSASISSFFANGISSKTFSVKAGKSGSVKIIVKPDTSTDTATLDGTLIKSSKTATVTIKTPSTPQTGDTSRPNQNTSSPNPNSDEKKSGENRLSSLTVSKGHLSPVFHENTTKYNISLAGDVKEVTIGAKAKDSKAKISGLGKKTVKVGENTFKVICTAENGKSKTYTLIFHVDETPLVYTKFDGQDLGVVRTFDGVKVPKGFQHQTIRLEGKDVDGFVSDQFNITLVYLVDEQGNKNFYIIEDGKVVSAFQKITVCSREYIVINTPEQSQETKGLQAIKVKIDNVELAGWAFADDSHKQYSLVYLMNDHGKKGLYSYESTEETLQLYTFNEVKNNQTLMYVLIGTTALFAITTLVMVGVHMRFKKKSIAVIKEYYKRKNQD